MATHRYWLMRTRTSGESLYVSLSDLAVSETLGGTNVISSATVTSNGGSTTNITDGSTATQVYLIGSGTTDISFDFGGTPKEIAEFRCRNRNDGWPYQVPYSGELYWSDDGTNYTMAWFYFGKTLGHVVAETQAYSPYYFNQLNVDLGRCRTHVCSNNYKTVTSMGAGSVIFTRRVTQKTYVEVSIPTITSGSVDVGIATVSAASNTLNNITSALAYNSSTGAVVMNSVTLSTIATYAAGDIICVAIDPSLQQIWFRVNNGNWNNSGTAAPATGVGGISYATIVGGAICLGVASSATGTTMTIKPESTDWSYSAPSGFQSFTATLSSVPVVNSAATVKATTISMPIAQTARNAGAAMAEGQRGFSPAATIKTVSGIVQEGGTPVAGKNVYLYDRITGDLLGKDVSDGSGAFSISAVGKQTTFAVAFDSPTYNAIIFDNVTPV